MIKYYFVIRRQILDAVSMMMTEERNTYLLVFSEHLESEVRGCEALGLSRDLTHLPLV
jgi:hypothetical protein